MTGFMEHLVSQLILGYEATSGKARSFIAFEMDIPISNYYLYRDSRGNPTAKTVDKIVEVIYKDHPEILETLLEQLRQMLAADPPAASES